MATLLSLSGPPTFKILQSKGLNSVVYRFQPEDLQGSPVSKAFPKNVKKYLSAQR